MNAKFTLPIGSIIILKNTPKKVMLVGFIPLKDGVVYDYMGVFYPEGIINNENILYINENDIESILTTGYLDNSEKEFKLKMNNYINNLNN